MAGKGKTLCKWDERRIEKKFKKFRKIVGNPRFVCKRCGRVAANKKSLCKPLALDCD
jgi:hypothetical protein